VAYSPFEEVVLPGIAAAACKAFVPAVVAACKASVPAVVAACKAFVPLAAAACKAFVSVAVAAYLAVVEASILEVVYSLPGGSALIAVLERRLILGSAALWTMKTFLAAAVVAAVAAVAAVTIDVHSYRFTTFFQLLRYSAPYSMNQCIA
jgi:hypothetical protein